MEEQKIIEEGLKKNTKQDIICYVGMALLFIMIFIPPIFRVVFYDKEVEKNEIDVVYLELSCRKAVYRDGKKVSMIINNSYRIVFYKSQLLNILMKVIMVKILRKLISF